VRGPISPLFLLEFKMINAAVVEGIIKDKLASENKYIVDLVVSPGNLISIEIDSLEGIQISDCVEVSKLIDANLDREVEDYELQVSSAGIGQPFKVKQQYHKNINRQIEILFKDGKKSIGTLTAVNDDDFEVSSEELVKVEGKKKKELQTKVLVCRFDEVKQVKDVISF